MTSTVREVVLVQDDADTRELYADLLRGEGMACLAFKDPAGAVEHLRGIATAPSLVICDYRMIPYPADVFLGELARMPHLARMRRLVLSGFPKIETQANSLGADVVLKKPFELDEFVEVVRRLSAG